MCAATDDVVVLVSDDGSPIGTAPRQTVHDAATPLHLAFSLYLRNPDGLVLMTRRALTKVSWPGVWTNSCCGHLRPGEQATDAVARRTPDELGFAVTDARVVLPDFRYRATDAHGVVENELCPVLVAETDATPSPNPEEVAEFTWVPWATLVHLARHAPALLSPWCVAQLRRFGDADPWAR